MEKHPEQPDQPLGADSKTSITRHSTRLMGFHLREYRKAEGDETEMFSARIYRGETEVERTVGVVANREGLGDRLPGCAGEDEVAAAPDPGAVGLGDTERRRSPAGVDLLPPIRRLAGPGRR